MLFSKCKINKNLEKILLILSIQQQLKKHTSNNDIYHSILNTKNKQKIKRSISVRIIMFFYY